jgi:hypothetical protein
MKKSVLTALACLTFGLAPFATERALAQGKSNCVSVGGALMTNVNVVAGTTNMGPVFGDLAGSVAAVPLTGAVGYRHYWVTTAGDTIKFADAILNAEPQDFLDGGSVIAIRWGHYGSQIVGGTGKFDGATGWLDYFGLVDFQKNTLVLRYSGYVCYANYVPAQKTKN